jgi:catechol 2,3-dioxygenase-like lactoylglutathione lyase family enzyme
MKTTFHHVHLFASDIDKSLRFYCEMLGAKVIFDREMAGARNVLISIGTGKINFYDQPPKSNDHGVMHHLGIETDDLEALVEHMKSKGFTFKKSIRDHGTWKYIMAEGPDHVLLELFQTVREEIPKGNYR